MLDLLETGYTKLQGTTAKQCNSLLKKVLTRPVLEKLKCRRTVNGATLLDVVRSGYEHFDSSIGMYAPDADAYSVFAELFDPAIEEYHLGFSSQQKHPAVNYGHSNKLVDLDPSGTYVISTRVRCARNVQDFPFNPCLTATQYEAMQSIVTSALANLSSDLAGTYHPLSSISKSSQQSLVRDHLLFQSTDRFLSAANALRHWPLGRGIHLNYSKTFVVWVNEEDALRIISMQSGGDLRAVYARLVAGLKQLERDIPFAHDPRLGYLTCCPSNLGTAMRASVLIRLPHLSKNMLKFRRLAKQYNLQIRGTHGEHSDSVDHVFDVSNMRRLGITEFRVAMEMQTGVLALIDKERELADQDGGHL